MRRDDMFESIVVRRVSVCVCVNSCLRFRVLHQSNVHWANGVHWCANSSQPNHYKHLIKMVLKNAYVWMRAHVRLFNNKLWPPIPIR